MERDAKVDSRRTKLAKKEWNADTSRCAFALAYRAYLARDIFEYFPEPKSAAVLCHCA